MTNTGEQSQKILFIVSATISRLQKEGSRSRVEVHPSCGLHWAPSKLWREVTRAGFLQQASGASSAQEVGLLVINPAQ